MNSSESIEPMRCLVEYENTSGPFSGFEPAHNDFNLIGSGLIETNGVNILLTCPRIGIVTNIGGPIFQRRVRLDCAYVTDVECERNVIHFAYLDDEHFRRELTLYCGDQACAERLAAILPKGRTDEFNPRLHGIIEFESTLKAHSPIAIVTVAIVAINALVFSTLLIVGVFSERPKTALQILWGSNFGPFTSDGDWWRLFTSLFLHNGLIHIFVNMWALASFGPVTERLYGRAQYLFIYIAAGVIGGCASIYWRPDVNSLGASGAIFGVLGALLATQIRWGTTYPANFVRGVQSVAFVFTVTALLGGLGNVGVDNASHLGGLIAGFFLGLVTSHPMSASRCFERSTLRRFMEGILLATAFVAVGITAAERASAQMVGDGRYWQVFHWFRAGEHSANGRFNAALASARAGNLTQQGLADIIDSDVLVFWREASSRTSAVSLSGGSSLRASLQGMHNLALRRESSFELLARGLRNNDQEATREAELEMKQLERQVKRNADAPRDER